MRRRWHHFARSFAAQARPAQVAGPRPLLATGAVLLAPAALLQLLMHPLLSGGSLRTWGLYWIYTALGVVLPGTLVALRTLSWRGDWLTWLGIGWGLGHAFELASLLLCRQAAHPRAAFLWIPLAYVAAWIPRREWGSAIQPLSNRGRVSLALALLFTITGVTYFAISLPEISTSPPYISDPWFHVSNAHEFRDHATIQDPRLAGEPFNYHLFGYAASAAASLATGEALAPLLLRYSGMSCVFLVALNLFNLGRAFSRGSSLAGALSALLVLFPLEFWMLVSPGLNFGTTYQLFGAYLSTSTLAGHVFLAPLLLLVYWYFRGMHWRNGWALSLLSFAGAGSKAMFGPVVLGGALGVFGWLALTRRRFDWPSFRLALFLSAGVLPALLPLIVGESSYAQSARWEFAEFALVMDSYDELLRWGLPDWLARSVWVIGFDTALLVGAALGHYVRRSDRADSRYSVFAWMSLAAALVPSLSISMRGAAQLFFLYYANVALAAIAGTGLNCLARSRYAFHTLIGSMVLWLATQLMLGFHGFLPIVDQEVNPIWWRVGWWTHAVTQRERTVRAGALGSGEDYSRKKLALTVGIREGLDWARTHLPPDAVFVVNVPNASPYNALCECRAFLETTQFHVRSHVGDLEREDPYFRWRRAVLAAWREGRPEALDLMARSGITHVFVDRINGDPVAGLERFGPPVFQRAAFAIFEVPAATEPRSPAESRARPFSDVVRPSAFLVGSFTSGFDGRAIGADEQHRAIREIQRIGLSALLRMHPGQVDVRLDHARIERHGFLEQHARFVEIDEERPGWRQP